MRKLFLPTLLSFSLSICAAQNNQNADSVYKAYSADMRIESNGFSASYYPNRPAIYSLDEKLFLKKIDSLKQPFLMVTKKYTTAFQTIDKNFISSEQRDIEYFFDRMILDYPYFHENHTRQQTKLSKSTRNKLDRHLKDFNDPSLLKSRDFQGMLRPSSDINLQLK